MSTKKKLLEAAAGNAGEASYVDDVFSTYLYEGTGSSATATSTSSALGFGFGHNIQFSSDGRYVATHLPDSAVYIWSLSSPYDATTITASTNFSFTSQTTNSQSSRLSDDGTKAYVADGTTDAIFQYDLSAAYDASSASYASKSLDISGQVTNPRGFFFKPDGTSLFIVCANNDAIYQYTLSTAWDLSTGSYASKSVSSGGETNPYNVFFNDTGTVMIICGSANGLTEFALSTAWDVSTASATGTTGNPDTYGTTVLSFAADFADNGSRLVVIDSAQKIGVGDLIISYDIDTIGDGKIIRNDIDLDGEGGLVWTKARVSTSGGNTGHALIDTERGSNKWLSTSATSAEATNANLITSFNSDGYSVGTGGPYWTNDNGYNYASWTFRKQPGFFDVVTGTADSSGNVSFSHNLGSTPGMVIIKRLDNGVTGWLTWHRSFSNTVRDYMLLNASDSKYTAGFDVWNVTDSTVDLNFGFTSPAESDYVAYLFAHDAQDFGTDEDESIIKCGSFTGPTATINLGFEPQWLLIKPSSTTANWAIYDVMRGQSVGGTAQELYPNLSNAEGSGGLFGTVNPEPTGFSVTGGYSASHIYVAIRRPHKPAKELAATDLFAPTVFANPSVSTTTGFPVDMFIQQARNTDSNALIVDRLRDTGGLVTQQTSSENGYWGPISGVTFDDMDGFLTDWSVGASSYAGWAFKRAPGFFDVVAYTGNGTAGRTVSHNLGVAPEMMWVKKRNSSGTGWSVYLASVGATKKAQLNYNGAPYTNSDWNNTNPTASVFSLGSSSDVNQNSDTYIAYLFATVDGISKVGSYTGTGSDVDVDCNFSAGARFVLVKRADSTGDWYLWDSERGIVAGNDPYLLLNSTAAEVTSTDYIDPLSSGFTITSGAPAALNASGGNYIFLAIA